MALTQINQTIELREISLSDRPNQLYQISRKGTVPVFCLITGEVIDESLDIMLWCFDQKERNTNYSSQIELIKFIDDDFKYWLDHYKYHERHLKNSKEYYRDKCAKILSQFENFLENSPFITGEDIQLVDMAIFPLIRQFIHVDKDWFSSSFHALTRWYKQIHFSPIFTSIMKKYEFWKEGNDPLLINFYQIENNEKLILKKL